MDTLVSIYQYMLSGDDNETFLEEIGNRYLNMNIPF